MAALTSLRTHHCASEDTWLARQNNPLSNPDTSTILDSNRKSRHNKNKLQHSSCVAIDTIVIAGFSNSRPGPKNKPFKGNRYDPTMFKEISERPCQIHDTPNKLAIHTNRNRWVIKAASKWLCFPQHS